MKIRPVGAELLNANGQTDMTKVIDASRNFANAPKNLKPEMYRNYSRTSLIRALVFRINLTGRVNLSRIL
jgi:hypothetical protein